MSDLVRFCPMCSWIGEVPHAARDCCPDGIKATYVDPEVARLAREGFQHLYINTKQDEN